MPKISAKDAIAKIKKMLFADGADPSGNQEEGVSYTLKDGTSIKVLGDINLGAMVMVADPDGDQPAPDGELELDNGTVITVVAGIITEIETAQEEIDEKDGNASPDVQMQRMRSEVSKLKGKIKTLEFEVQNYKDFISEHTKDQKQLLELVRQIAEQPASSPIEKPRNTFSEVRLRQDDRMKDLAKTLLTIKNNK